MQPQSIAAKNATLDQGSITGVYMAKTRKAAQKPLRGTRIARQALERWQGNEGAGTAKRLGRKS